MTAWLLSLGKTIQTPAVDEEEIEPAIVIVVIKCEPAACGFEQVFIPALRAIGGCDGKAGLSGDVDVAHAEWSTFNRRLRARRRWCGLGLVTALLGAYPLLRKRCLLQR